MGVAWLLRSSYQLAMSSGHASSLQLYLKKQKKKTKAIPNFMKKEDNLPSRISVCKASIGISWAKCKQTIHEIASPCTLMLRMKRNTGGASGLRWNVLAASKPCKLNSIIQVFGVVPQSLPKWAIQQFISPVCRYPSVWSRSLSLSVVCWISK